MFDFNLHLRFLQKATEAFFAFGQASVAAGCAWQSRVHEQFASDDFRPMPWPALDPSWMSPSGFMPSAFVPPGFMPMSFWQMDPVAFLHDASNYWPSVSWLDMAPSEAGAPNPWRTGAMAWNFMPWSAYQAPMMAMLVCHGVPHAVAAPAARAGTSAMDAADAAYAQWSRFFPQQAEAHAAAPLRWLN